MDKFYTLIVKAVATVAILFVGLFYANAQLAVTPNNNGVQLAQALTGKGVSIYNVSLNCANDAAGTFNNALPTIGLNNGVVLSTGLVSNLMQPSSSFMGDFLFTPSDPDLDALVNNTNYDACVLEFDIRPLGDTIDFSFVFASEEYPEYVCSNFNDVFAFFLSGPNPMGGNYANANIAKIPGTNLAVAINTVNPGVAGGSASGGNCNKPGESKAYSSLYRTNNSNDFVMDGMTVAIKARTAVVACEVYHLKFAIQDAGDGSYDSGVFLTTIKSNSVTVRPFTNVPLPQDTADLFEDPSCNQGGFRFELDTVYPYPTTVRFDVLGTATNGVDYQTIIDSVVIPAGSSFVTLPIIPINDNLVEGKETVGLYLLGSCTNDYVDSSFMYIYDELSANAGPDTNLCPGQPLQFNGASSTDFPWLELFSFNWYPAQYVSDDTIANPMFVQTNLPNDTVYLYLRTQVMNCKSDTDTVMVALTRKVRFSIDAGPDDTICIGQTSLLNLNVVDSANEAPFTYIWTPAASLNDSSIQDPIASPDTTTKYKVQVNNQYGCPLTDSVQVFVPPLPTFTLTRSQDTVCPAFQVQLSFLLQSGNYDSIVWLPSIGANAVSNRNGVNTQITPATTQLYRLVAYLKGCTVEDSILVVVDDAMTVDAGNDTTICVGNSVQLNALVTGNRGAVTYSWQPANTLDNSTIVNPLATPTAPTTYIVTTSSVGCIKTDSVRINAYSISAVLVPTDVSCFGGSDGTLTATGSNGIIPYSYVWSNSAPDAPTQSGLPMGAYTVTIADANGCTAIAGNNINEPAPLEFTITTVTDVKCFGGSDGNIAVQSGGGNPNYTYTWQPSVTGGGGPNLPNLIAGTYFVTVTDTKGCTADTSFVVNQPTELLLDSITTNVTCNGGSNGSITVTPSGGTPNYTYLWSDNTTQSSLQNISAGSYSVTVTDNNQCTKQLSFTITQPPAIVLTGIVVNNVSCFGGNDGAATVNVANGVSPFSYAWSNNQTNDTAIALTALVYNVTVTDADNCTATTSVTIQEPALLTLALNTTDVRCYAGGDGSITSTVNGGTTPYAYLWSTNQTTANISQLPIGTYSLLVTDALGCTAEQAATINQPDSLQARATTIRETCIALWDGKLIPAATGGTIPYTFAYSNDAVSYTPTPRDTVRNLMPDTYTVRVTDGNNCVALAQGIVGSPPKDIYDYTVTSTSCYGVAYRDGSISIRGLESANSPFKFSLNNDGVFTNGDFKNLAVGFYPIYVLNNNGCDTTVIVEVPEPVEADLRVLPSDTTIGLGEQVLLNVRLTPYGDSTITSYSWSPQQGLSCTDCANPIVTTYDDETIYEVTVTYNNKCVATAEARVLVDASPEVFVPNMFTPNGDGINDKFFVYGLNIRDFSLKIFNRWGEKVYESTEQTDGWDGFFRNTLQEPGAYVYYLQVTYLNNKDYSKTGSVTLVK